MGRMSSEKVLKYMFGLPLNDVGFDIEFCRIRDLNETEKQMLIWTAENYVILKEEWRAKLKVN